METDVERKAILRFRYTISVEEMGQYRDTADPTLEPFLNRSLMLGFRLITQV